MGEHVVTSANELGEGEHIVVEVEGREIGIFNIDGELHAYTNWCAHQSGPICEGPKAGFLEANYNRESKETEYEYSREGEIIACPWHGWEFDLVTGECHSKPSIRLISHEVTVENDEIVLTV